MKVTHADDTNKNGFRTEGDARVEGGVRIQEWFTLKDEDVARGSPPSLDAFWQPLNQPINHHCL